MAKTKVLLSLDPDTAERLKQYAFENHTNVSQAVTDWIWSAKVKNTQVRGQIGLVDPKKKGGSSS